MIQKFCQSCSMPLENPQVLGTEADGSRSHIYCSHCYLNGVFVQPGMTLKEMTAVVKWEMEKRNIDEVTIAIAVSSLPHLTRWKA